MAESNKDKTNCSCGHEPELDDEADAPGGESACQLHNFPEWNDEIPAAAPPESPMKKTASDPAQ